MKYFEIDTFCDLKNNYIDDKSIKKYYKQLKKLNTRYLYYQENEKEDLEEFFTKMKLTKVFINNNLYYINEEVGIYIEGYPKEISLRDLAIRIRNVFEEDVSYFFNHLKIINEKDNKNSFMLKLKK